MRRLYWRIYLGIVAVIVVFAVAVGLVRWLDLDDGRRDGMVASVAATVAELLPADPAAVVELRDTIARLAGRFDADARVYSPGGELLAAVGAALPVPPVDGVSGWVHGQGGHGFALALPDGRWLVVRPRGGGRHGSGWLLLLALAALVIAIGAYPMARRITRRLERLQLAVEELGAGDLSARVPVEGRDEVARLADAFNRAALRIEELVRSQQSTLAGASHELRSPLARIRMATELLGDDVRADLRERMERDVAELDDLIEELLLASRLQAQAAPVQYERIDLSALLAEETARVGGRCGAGAIHIDGDARLLRRLLRNLLENALRHGGDSVESAVIEDEAGFVRIEVCDRGPGVDVQWRERIFEPFFRPPGLREGDDPGVGLGLSLVRQIARHHGGDVRCEDREGGGSRFVVRLPAAAATPAA